MATRPGFFQKIVAAQERRAQQYVNEALSRLDDETLTGLGYSPAEVRKRPRRLFL